MGTTPFPRLRVSTWTVIALSTLAAALVLGRLSCALIGPTPPRDVVFDGGWASVNPSCHGPDFWDGTTAWSACAWGFDDRALVAFDPERATAKVMHRWTTRDGNSPSLRIVRPCGEGRLFVVGETQQTTVVLLEADRVSSRVAKLSGRDVRGAACHQDVIELFAESGLYSTPRTGEREFEQTRTFAPSELPDSVFGAWLEGASWHVIGRKGQLVAEGEAGGQFAYIASVSIDACLAGEPGGWLFLNGGVACSQFLRRVGESWTTFSVEPAVSPAVVYLDRTPTAGGTRDADPRTFFKGLGPLDFELDNRGASFEARRADRDPVAVAKSTYSSLDVGARALPLPDDRVAVWGSLGKTMIVLGPELEREDRMGALHRLVRPWRRFSGSANSTFDQFRYFALLALTPGFFVALFGSLRAGRPEGRLRAVSVVYLALFAVGVWGFSNVLKWL